MSSAILEKRLSKQRWVASDDEPTIADIVLAAPMHLHGWQQLPLSDHPALKRWLLEGVEQLPCWQQTAVYEGFTTTRPN